MTSSGLIAGVVQPFADSQIWTSDSTTAWRISTQEDFFVEIRSTAAALLADTQPAAGNVFRELRYVGTAHQKFAEPFSPSATAALGEARWELQKINNPTGNIWAEVWSSVVGPQGVPIPNTLLATSNTVAASTVGTSFGDVTFTFPGGQQPTLSTGTTYMAVLNGDTPVSVYNHIRARSYLATGNPGNCSMFGTGAGFDRQNHPDTARLFTEQIAPVVFSTVPWTVPLFKIGGRYRSPNVAVALQACIDRVDWTDNLPVGLGFRSGTSTTFGRYATWPRLGHTPPVDLRPALEVFYIPKAVAGATVQNLSVAGANAEEV